MGDVLLAVTAAVLGLVLVFGHRRLAVWLAESDNDPLASACRDRVGGPSARVSLRVARAWFLLAGVVLLLIAAQFLRRGP